MKSRRLVSLAALLLATNAASQSYQDGGIRPSWFPKKSCDTTWQRYDFSESYDDYINRMDRTNCYKKWSVLVYIAADNDLTPYALRDISLMEAGYKSDRPYGGSTRFTDLVLELDTSQSTDFRRIHVFQRPKAEAYDRESITLEQFRTMGEEGIRSPTVMKIPEEANPTHETAFEDFLRWGIRAYPSEHVMVIVWGHGQGWTSDPAAAALGGLAFDDSKKTFLSIPSLHRALKNTVDEVLEGRQIDVYLSNACLMQMTEVAYELSDAARYVIGSTQVVNFLSLPYRRIMYQLNTCEFAGFRRKLYGRGVGCVGRGDLGSARAQSVQALDEPWLLAHMVPETFRASYNGPSSTNGYFDADAIRLLTMSSISTDRLSENLVPKLEELASRMSDFIHEFDAEDPVRGQFRAVDFSIVMTRVPAFQGGAQDLGVFLAFLEIWVLEESEHEGEETLAGRALHEHLAIVKDALNDTVMNWFVGPYYLEDLGMAPLRPKAFSVWLPQSSSDYKARIRDFRSSRFYQAAPSWERMLEATYKEF